MSVKNWHRLIWIDELGELGDPEEVELVRQTYEDKYLYFPSYREFLDNQVEELK